MRLHPLLLSISVLAFALFASGCGDDVFGGDGDSTLPESNRCAQSCEDGAKCFEFENGPACVFPECENNTAVCAVGYNCDPQTDTCEKPVCEGGCEPGSHCVYGNCIFDYNAENVCAPLLNCRTACQTSDDIQECVSVCQRDASRSCRSCLDTQGRCEERNNCNANASNCCVNEYCTCFPSAAGCLDPDAPPCEGCADACRSASNPERCLSNCAEQVIECSTCLRPFSECSEDVPPSQVNTECRDEFCDCVTCESTADADFNLQKMSLMR